MRVQLFLRGWLLLIGNLRLCRVLTGNLGLLFPTKLVISVGVDNVYKGWVLYMCSLFSVSGCDMGVGLDRHWLESISSAVS